MGNGGSKQNIAQVINSYIQSSVNIQTNVLQNCSTYISNTQEIKVVCDPSTQAQYPKCGNINIHDIDMSQLVKLDATCVQNAVLGTDFVQNIKNAASAGADALKKSYNITNSDAQTQVTNLCTKIADAVTTTVQQNCSNNIVNNQIIVVNTTGNVDIDTINMSQTVDAVVQCIMQTSTVTTAVQDLANYLQQQGGGNGGGGTSGDITSMLENYGFFAAVIVLTGGALFFSEHKMKAIVLGLFVTSIYLIVNNYVMQLFPYDANNANQNQTVVEVAGTVGALCFVVLIVLFIHQHSQQKTTP